LPTEGIDAILGDRPSIGATSSVLGLGLFVVDGPAIAGEAGGGGARARPAPSSAAAPSPAAAEPAKPPPISETSFIASTAATTWIYAEPDIGSKKLGYLRAGAS